ncbi:MAG: AMP-binding protein, partial [bacterium]|nr:AMP-binding protein [bacterium]
IGMFVNTLVMRNYPGGEKTFLAFLKEVIRNSIQAFENQDLQFEDLVEKLEPERDPSRNPLFDISLVVVNFRQVGEESSQTWGPDDGIENRVFRLSSGVDVPSAVYKNPTSKVDISFLVFEKEGVVHFNIEYYTRVFKAGTIRGLMTHFKNIIRAVIHDPAVPLQEIEIITSQEKRQILYEFNDTAVDFPEDKPIHRLFAQQASRTLEEIAVVAVGRSAAGERYMTYRQLDEGSNRLANYLYRRKQIRPEEPVGILISDVIHLPVAILGVLKAGGAYVPVEPSLPLARKRSIIDDANIGLVISQRQCRDDLDRLQWECGGLHGYLFMDKDDTVNPVRGEEGTVHFTNKELWEHVGETATDDISGGGWSSSYTGKAMSREEMDEYGDNILKKLEPLLHPNMRVLEIGCASG